MKSFLTPAQLRRVQSLPGNDRCADCREEDPLWVSLPYGTLICLRCSGEHRGLGVHVSFVRSLKLDNFSREQFMKVAKSSNDSFNSVFGIKGKSIPISIKYSCLEAQKFKNEDICADDFESWESLLAKKNAYVEKPYVWIADNSKKACMQCNTKFSLFVRKHHCRSCGELVCSDCAPSYNTKPLYSRGYTKPVRHCRKCFQSPALRC